MQAISPQGVEDSGNYPESRCNENYPGKPILSPLGLMPGDYSGVTCKPRFHARRYARGGARSPSHLFVCAMCLRLPAAGLPKIKVGSLIGAIGYVRLGRERFNIRTNSCRPWQKRSLDWHLKLSWRNRPLGYRMEQQSQNCYCLNSRSPKVSRCSVECVKENARTTLACLFEGIPRMQLNRFDISTAIYVHLRKDSYSK